MKVLYAMWYELRRRRCLPQLSSPRNVPRSVALARRRAPMGPPRRPPPRRRVSPATLALRVRVSP
eukprot:7583328-Alexandrium_andersonii.AAC.1